MFWRQEGSEASTNLVDIKFGLILLTSQSEAELLCKMRKVGRMQRTTDMNILLNMSLNTLNIDLMSCHCLVVISFLSLMVDRIWFTEEINIHSFFFYLFYILHIVVPYKKFAEVNVWLPELILRVHMYVWYLQNKTTNCFEINFYFVYNLVIGKVLVCSRGNKQMWAVLSDISITMHNVYCIMSPW